MALTFKRSDVGASKIVKINRYQNSKYAIDLMARICMEKPSDYSLYFKELYAWTNKEDGFAEYIESIRSDLENLDFEAHLQHHLYYLKNAFSANETQRHTKIVVAGGFSSGKSSFLNYITGASGLLPTGIQPVSVVATNLLCKKELRSIKTKGENLRGKLVALPVDVMECIQHSNESKVYIASVLNKLFLEIPNEDLDGFMFVDTPGYDNQDSTDGCGETSDKATAQNELKDGDVLFWVIDIERGAITAQDINMINSFGGKKLVVFNKADKKTPQDIIAILDLAIETLKSGLSEPDSLLDVVALSSNNPEIYQSFHGNSLADLLNQAKKIGEDNGCLVDLVVKGIESLFDKEIDHFNQRIKIHIDKCEELIPKKNGSLKTTDENNESVDNLLAKLEEITCESYDEIIAARGKLDRCFVDLSNLLDDAITKSWNINNNALVTHQSINNILQTSNNNHKNLLSKYNSACDYNYYNREYRENILKICKEDYQLIKGFMEDITDGYSNEIEATKTLITQNEKAANLLKTYKIEFIDILKNVIDQCNKQSIIDNSLEYNESKLGQTCIFNAIRTSNFDHFTLCFTNGIDIKLCNEDGYTPLTYAVAHGENEMVEFLLKYTDDILECDKRGYNALHTAVENQFKDLCGLLVKREPSLRTSYTQCGMSVTDIVNKNRNHFYEWIQTSHFFNY